MWCWSLFLGLIPACAGKTNAVEPCSDLRGAHPRVCGENPLAAARPILAPGSSPRVRGKPDCATERGDEGRLIPACAGKTSNGKLQRRRSWAHPRVCGENRCAGRNDDAAVGSSPRVRGKPPLGTFPRTSHGLIPACAGKTTACYELNSDMRAHPRVCGENDCLLCTQFRHAGSSPRVRGKRPMSIHKIKTAGLIPACAGKTRESAECASYVRAHPRVCGENGIARVMQITRYGSSPRVRGKRLPGRNGPCSGRLIPACAGKTPWPANYVPIKGAHPRVCGENGEASAKSRKSIGSSPRVRGKPLHLHVSHTVGRLIPACAGKTTSARSSLTSSKAHPRVCGENRHRAETLLQRLGSSPRVRGKPCPCSSNLACSWLIPACAGKTDADHVLPGRQRAHPRVCGENRALISSRSANHGSSPRVRGKLTQITCCQVDKGLIPACAGKTATVARMSSGNWAHPRVCGENAPRRTDSS